VVGGDDGITSVSGDSLRNVSSEFSGLEDSEGFVTGDELLVEFLDQVVVDFGIVDEGFLFSGQLVFEVNLISLSDDDVVFALLNLVVG